MRLKGLVFATVLLLFSSAALTLVGKESEAAERTVSIVIDAEPGLAVRHGLGQLAQALQALGWKVEQIVIRPQVPARELSYWHFFQVFGRVGYNPQTSPKVWKKSFEKRFGPAAAPWIERALHQASRVLPMITAYNFPYNRFPTTRGWPEKQRREDLPQYAAAEPSDTEQFLSLARVQDPSGVRWVRLRYRNVSQFEDYQTLSMEPTGEGDLYAGTLPGEALSPKWDLMYFKETPYIIVRLGSPAEHSEAAN